MSMKNFNDTIGNRTRDLPACSALPQPIAPPRAPTKHSKGNKTVPGKVATTRTEDGHK